MLIRVGLVGPKERPIGVTDGQQVKIPVLVCVDKDFKGGQNGKTFATEHVRKHTARSVNSKLVEA